MNQMGKEQSAIQAWKEQTMEQSGIDCIHDCRYMQNADKCFAERGGNDPFVMKYS